MMERGGSVAQERVIEIQQNRMHADEKAALLVAGQLLHNNDPNIVVNSSVYRGYCQTKQIR